MFVNTIAIRTRKQCDRLNTWENKENYENLI